MEIETIIKIFLASSIVEFEHERHELGDYISSLNKHFLERGILLQFEKCEDLSNAISDVRKQEEYNQVIRDSDFFYIVFGKSAGEYTIEEFDVALEHFRKEKKPHIYTFFQKLPEGVEATDSVKAFMTRLDKEIGHYYSLFSHIDSIKLNMLLEITRLKMLNEKIDIRDGKALVNGKEMLSLENVPIFRNNEELQKLQEEISVLRKERAELAAKFAENPDDMEVYHKLSEVANRNKETTEQLQKMEKTILDLCSTIAERNSSGKPINWWEKEASQCLDEGNYEGALAILRDPGMEKELEQAEEIGGSVQDRRIGYINAKRLQIQTLKSKGVNQETLPEIYECYEKCEKIAKKNRLETDNIYEYASFLLDQNEYKNALDKAEWLQKYYDSEEDVYNNFIENHRKADLYNLLGMLYSETNRYVEAEEAYKKEIEIYERLAEENPVAYKRNLAGSYGNIGNLYYKTGRYMEAEETYKKVVEIFGRLAEENPAAYERNLAESYNNTGILYNGTGRYTESEEAYKNAVEIQERLAKENPAAYERDLADSYYNIGNLYSDTGRYTEAEEVHKKAIKIYERLAEENPAACERNLAESYNNIGILYSDTGRYTEAVEVHKKAIKIYERLAKENPEAYTSALAWCYNSIGILYSDTGRYIESEEVYKKAIEIYERLAEENPAAYERDLADSYNNIGILYYQTGRYTESEETYKNVIEIRERLAEKNPAAYERHLAESYNNIGILYRVTDRYTEAEEVYKRAVEIYERLAEENPAAYERSLTESYNNIGNLYSDVDRYTEAEEVYKRVIEIYERLAEENPAAYERHLAKSYNNIGILYSRTGRYKEAEEAYKKVVEIFGRLAEENPAAYAGVLASSYGNTGNLYYRMGRYKEAEEAYKKMLALQE